MSWECDSQRTKPADRNVVEWRVSGHVVRERLDAANQTKSIERSGMIATGSLPHGALTVPAPVTFS